MVLERQISKILTAIFERLFFRIFPGPRECIPVFGFLWFLKNKVKTSLKPKPG